MDPTVRMDMPPATSAILHFDMASSIDPSLDVQYANDNATETGSPAPSVQRSRRGNEEGEELKRLARETEGLSLHTLARRVRDDESTPNAEKSRQIFGMRWLGSNCQRVDDSSAAVPRNHVYNKYVRACLSEKIRALNPASFGKLVRLRFPDIKTRRLGVRGQSKYHYCGIRLIIDGGSHNVTLSNGEIVGTDGQPLNTTQDVTVRPVNAPEGTVLSVAYLAATNTLVGHDENTSSVGHFIQNYASFRDQDAVITPLNAPLNLPNILLFAPQGTDEHIVMSLAAAYQSHCVHLIECIRYMKLKQFFSTHGTFLANLSGAEVTLFTDPCMASWVEECDWATYQIILRLLSPLALEAAPTSVLMALRQLCSTLSSTIAVHYAHHQIPAVIVDAKNKPTKVFCSLIDRLLRVNESAHAAGRILLHKPDRDIMRDDWQKYVKTQPIVEREISCQPLLVKSILDGEISALLIDNNTGNQTCLDRWTSFLNNLPSRFPGVSPRLFIMLFDSVYSAALRDMTMNGGDSFGGWWVVKCWADELLRWTSEKNAFLAHQFDPSTVNFGSSLNGSSQGSEDDDDLGPDDSGISINQSMLEGFDGTNGVQSSI